MGVTVTGDTIYDIKDKLGLKDPQGDIIITWDKDYNHGYDIFTGKRSGIVTVHGEPTRFKDSEHLADVLNETILYHDLQADLKETYEAEERAKYEETRAKEEALKKLAAEYEVKRTQVLGN